MQGLTCQCCATVSRGLVTLKARSGDAPAYRTCSSSSCQLGWQIFSLPCPSHGRRGCGRQRMPALLRRHYRCDELASCVIFRGLSRSLHTAHWEFFQSPCRSCLTWGAASMLASRLVGRSSSAGASSVSLAFVYRSRQRWVCGPVAAALRNVRYGTIQSTSRRASGICAHVCTLSGRGRSKTAWLARSVTQQAVRCHRLHPLCETTVGVDLNSRLGYSSAGEIARLCAVKIFDTVHRRHDFVPLFRCSTISARRVGTHLAVSASTSRHSVAVTSGPRRVPVSRGCVEPWSGPVAC